MAIGKITGSVVADNTLTESNLAFGIDGQSSATSWATDTLKVNIIESDDSTAIQLNDSLNISGTLSANTIDVNTLTSGDSSAIQINDAINVSGDITTAGTVEMDRLSLSSNQTTVSPLQLTANSLQDGVGALRIDGAQADIFLNPSTATHTTVTFAVNNDQRLAFGMDNASDFYITRRTGGTWYDDTFVIDRDTGELRYGYDVSISGSLSVNTIASSDSTAIQINDGLNVSGTLSANTIDVNQLQSGDSTNIRVADNLVPAADNTYSLGTADRKWSALYVTGSTIFLDTTKLQVDGSGDFTVKDAGNNLKRVVASEIEIGTGSNKIKMQRGANGRVKFLDENDTPTPVLQIVGDDSTGVSLNTNETVKIAGGNSISTVVSGDTLTVSLDKSIDVNTIQSSDSTAIQINDGLNVSGTVSADTIDVNTITSGDSTGININDTKLYVNGSTVLTVDTADEPTLTTSAADVDHVIINDGGIAKRIALGNINVSSFNNDANYASAASTGFVNSTVTTIPISSDSTATDYSEDEEGVGTATDTTDAFGVPLGTTFDTMEPRGTTQATDFGTEEAYVGA